VPDGSRSTRPFIDTRIQQIFAATIRAWPWSSHRLILMLRVSEWLGASLVLVLAWWLMAALPSAVDAVIAILACLAFAYCFERGGHLELAGSGVDKRPVSRREGVSPPS
jgi:hypothetical protein